MSSVSTPHGPRDQEVVYLLEAADLAHAAGAVARALDVTLHEHRSPMIGPWCADVSPTTLAAAVAAARAGDPAVTATVGIRVMVTTNDPEAGVVPPEVPTATGGFVLRASIPDTVRGEVEQRLAEAGVGARRISPGEGEAGPPPGDPAPAPGR